MKKTIIVIFGPTGVGKTKTSIEIAKKLNGEIVSCDSMQIYKKMDIGTAKITKEEMGGVPHHLIDIVSPNEEFSVGEYVKLANEKFEEIFERGKQPILVGGTGLYINALTKDFDFGNASKDEEIRNKYKAILEEKGKEFLHNVLKSKDEEIAKRIHENDTKKVIRALEILENGKKIEEKQEQSKKYNYLIFGLNTDRERIYENINKRAKEMFKNGLIEEVKNLQKQGLSLENQSMQGIGYKEVVVGIEEGKTTDEILELIQRKTRNYAKRQLTFMRGIKELIWIDSKNAVQEILGVINGN